MLSSSSLLLFSVNLNTHRKKTNMYMLISWPSAIRNDYSDRLSVFEKENNTGRVYVEHIFLVTATRLFQLYFMPLDRVAPSTSLALFLFFKIVCHTPKRLNVGCRMVVRSPPYSNYFPSLHCLRPTIECKKTRHCVMMMNE